MANNTIGTGPRLQMLIGDDVANREIKREFNLRADEVSLTEKLRTVRMARAQDREALTEIKVRYHRGDSTTVSTPCCACRKSRIQND